MRITTSNYVLINASTGTISNDIINNIIDKFNIYLADNLSYSISLHNLNWSLSLIFEEWGSHDKQSSLNDLQNSNNNDMNPNITQLEEQKNNLMSQLESEKQQYLMDMQNKLNLLI